MRNSWWDCNDTEEDLKIYNHELLRLANSLKEAKKLNCEKTLVVLHYPPFDLGGDVNADIKDMFRQYGVTHCTYGHLHGAGTKNAPEGEFFGTKYYLTSADYLNFSPLAIKF